MRPLLQRSGTIVVASLVFPPAGLLLLWLRKGTPVLRKAFATLPILVLGVLHLFLVYGLRVELAGDLRPRLRFGGVDDHYRRLEQDRAAQRAALPPAGAPAPSAPDAPGPEDAGSTFWADFRGPGRIGHYDQRPILLNWPQAGLEQVWKQPVGGGYASFTVARSTAFTIEQRRGNEVVSAYDILTGRELWTNSWPAFFQETMGGDGPRATPVWDDGRVYALGAEGELRCLDAATGKLLWNKNILSDNGASNIPWGMANSPLVMDGALVVTPGGSGGRSVVAYDKLTGARLWSSLDDQAAYTSPMLVTLGGRQQILVVTASRAVGLGVEDGTLLWDYPWVTHQGINVAQPVVVSANRFFLSAGYGHGAALVELNPDGDRFQARTVWSNSRMKNKMNSSVLYEGNIYGLDEGILACMDAETGELKWKGGRYGYGQLLLASAHLVVLTEDGDVVLVRASPDALQEVARFGALEGKTWNHPAIADGLLLVRNTTDMACFRVSGR